ncbi:MAG: hypothetical protein EOO11_18275, partial [Chitinophagaceae bacterium]
SVASSPLKRRRLAGRRRRLPASLRLFNGELATLVLNETKNSRHPGLEYAAVKGFGTPALVGEIVSTLHARGIQSLLVEGGTRLLQGFIDAGLWDEALVLTNTELCVGDGIAAPQFTGGALTRSQLLLSDRADHYRRCE